MKKLILGTIHPVHTETARLSVKITTRGAIINGYIYTTPDGYPAEKITYTGNLTKTCLKGRLTGEQLTDWSNMIGGRLINNETGCSFYIPTDLISRIKGAKPAGRAFFRLDDTQALALVRAITVTRTAERLAADRSPDTEQQLIDLAKRVERERLDIRNYNRRQNRIYG